MPKSASANNPTPEHGHLTIAGQQLAYSVVRSAQRRRSYGFTVEHTNGQPQLVFRAPRWVSVPTLLSFANTRQRFIRNRLAELAHKAAHQQSQQHLQETLKGKYSPLPVAWWRKAARQLLVPMVAAWARQVGVKVTLVRITSGKTVWGSCNAQGAINLSYRLLLVPNDLRDYVVLHEVCHRVHMHHGPRFWRLVEHFMPDYTTRRQQLNQLGATLG